MRKDFVNFPAAPLFLLSKGYTNAVGRPKIGPEIILERRDGFWRKSKRN